VITPSGKKLYPFEELEKRPVLHDQIGSERVLIVFHPDIKTAVAWTPSWKNQKLDFELGKIEKTDVTITDKQTGSTWSGLTGRCVAGPSKNGQLRQLTTTQFVVENWLLHYPDSPGVVKIIRIAPVTRVFLLGPAQDQRVGMKLTPFAPSGLRRRQTIELSSLEWTGHGLARGLCPEAVSLIIVKEERFLIQPAAMAEVQCLILHFSDIHDARPAQRSVADQNRNASNRIDYHLMIV
jgi:hypothetical protein